MDGGRNNVRLGDHPAPGFDASTQALLSALIRECSSWSVREHAGSLELELPLPSQAGVVVVGLREPVGVGRIAAGPARWRDAAGELRPLPIDELVTRLVTEPSVAATLGLDAADGAAADRFVARVRASAHNLEQVLLARAADIEHLLGDPLGFVEAEQGLLLGHSVHPAPRLRERLGDDGERFVPELGGRTQLELCAVARERLFVGGLGGIAALDGWIASDPEWAERAHELDDGLALVPLHPLQIRALLDDGHANGVRRLGLAGRSWAPTSSLRTLHADGSPWMIKASLPLRLTNSLRTLAPAELERGVLLGRVLDETEAGALERRHRSFRILREPAYFGLADDAGGPGPRASFFALRENPFAADAPVEALAVLLQDHPRTGRSRLALRIEQAAARSGRRAVALAEQWMASFLVKVLEPIVEAQAEFGLLLSAHQQNLLIAFVADGDLAGVEPRAAWFRDAQGTAYTQLAMRRFGERLPGIGAARFAAPLAERVWAYSVVINGVFNVIASLSMIPGVAQSALLEQLRATLESQRERGYLDRSALDYLLDAPQLWTKANVFCFASGVDEVSLADPQVIYRAMPNPLARPEPAESVLPSAGRQCVSNFAHAAAIVEWRDLPDSGWRAGRMQIGDRALGFEARDVGGRLELRWVTPALELEQALLFDHLFSSRVGLAHVVDGERVIVRETFYQQPAPWHHLGDAAPRELGHVQTRDITHPRRPESPAGLLCRRYCPSIDRSFSLHAFDRDRDFDRFCGWMNDPVVASFWEQAWSRERLRDYLDERFADPHVIPAIGWFDRSPFAYFEIYWAKEDRVGPHYAVDDYDRGFHMAVGDAEVRHRGWGRQWFLAMAHFLFLDDPRTQRLVGEPRVDQHMVRAWSASTPWEEWGEIQFPHKRAALMVMTRERFFAGFEGRSR